MLERIRQLGRALSTYKGDAIFNGASALLWVFICAYSSMRHSQTWLIPICALNAAIFAFGAGSSLMRHVCEQTISAGQKYIDELEVFNRELRQDYYQLLAGLNLKQDLSDEPHSDDA